MKLSWNKSTISLILISILSLSISSCDESNRSSLNSDWTKNSGRFYGYEDTEKTLQKNTGNSLNVNKVSGDKLVLNEVRADNYVNNGNSDQSLESDEFKKDWVRLSYNDFKEIDLSSYKEFEGYYSNGAKLKLFQNQADKTIIAALNKNYGNVSNVVYFKFSNPEKYEVLGYLGKERNKNSQFVFAKNNKLAIGYVSEGVTIWPTQIDFHSNEKLINSSIVIDSEKNFHRTFLFQDNLNNLRVFRLQSEDLVENKELGQFQNSKVSSVHYDHEKGDYILKFE